MEYNLEKMARELYCPDCKCLFIKRELAPLCPKCGSILVTIVYSLITGKRITGEKND